MMFRRVMLLDDIHWRTIDQLSRAELAEVVELPPSAWINMSGETHAQLREQAEILLAVTEERIQ